MKQQLQSLLGEILADMGVSDVVPDVMWSGDPRHGEYTTNIAMRLAGKLKKSPMDIALQVKKNIEDKKNSSTHKSLDHKNHKKNQNSTSSLSDLDILQVIDHVEIAPPGFLNVFLSEVSLSNTVRSVLKDAGSYGTVRIEKKAKQTVMVEYTDPNPFKEFHIGHLYSNAVGESVARLHEAIGWSVVRSDYFGDVGMHVAKSIWGLRKKMAEDGLTLEELEKQPVNDRVHYLGMSYSVGATIYEEKTPEADAAREEMKDMNYMVYLAAQEHMKKELGWKPQIDYGQYVQGKSGRYADVKELFEKGRSWSMEYFETIFRRLGTRFDAYYPESIVGEYGAKLVHEHMKDVFETSDGAVVFRGAHTRVFLNSLGLPTYEAKELGLNWKKSQDYPLDKSIIVTGNEINEYFTVLFEAMRTVIPDVAAKTIHIGHGMVRLPEGKMSSRTGKIISGEGLLEEVKRSIHDVVSNNRSNYSKNQAETIAEKAAIAAIKYSMLRVALPANIAFDFTTSLSFDGDSGPYLLYTYARCKSVLRKSGGETVQPVQLSDLNGEERELTRLMLRYPEVVAEAAHNLSPNGLCSFLFRLGQTFNLFYQKHKILGHQRASERLALTAAVAQVLKNGLYLLGIETVEQM